MNKEIAEQVAKLERLVVCGEHEVCREMLILDSFKNLPRDLNVKVADLAIRVHLPIDALKRLHPFVYPENSFLQNTTAQEKIVYASALYNLGAIRESLELLSEIKIDDHPEVLFHRASAHFFSWNYSRGIPELKKFVDSKKINNYRKTVGEVNLAAAYISTSDWSMAHSLLDRIQIECEAQNYQLLLGNCFELRAQIHVYNSEFDLALEDLDHAEELLKHQNGSYTLFVEKWQVICRFYKEPSSENEKRLDVFRSKALQMRQWATVRECDLFASIIKKDTELFEKVIMGTESEFYLQRARKLFGVHSFARGHYRLRLGSFSKVSLAFDPYSKGTLTEALYEKPLLFKLFSALTRDFYQPSNLGMLFQKIYPDEKFNPFNSPQRVLQLLRRLNSWFKKFDLPLRVQFQKSEFRIIALQTTSVLLKRGETASISKLKLTDLKKLTHDRALTIVKISELLQISKSSARRLVQQALSERKMVKYGAGRSSLYQFNSPKRKPQAA